MKLAQFKTKDLDKQRVGVLIGDVVCDLAELAGAIQSSSESSEDWLLKANSMLEIIVGGPAALEKLKALVNSHRSTSPPTAIRAYELSEIDFLPAVYPSKILAIGRNYVDHAIEGGAEPLRSPMIFNKLPNSLSAHEAPIMLPTVGEKIDSEAELAVVIGRRAKQVSEAEALDYVFGYTLINDVTARDLQRGDGQWTRGKGLDTFAPLGPFITTRDDVSDVHNLKVEGLLNGEVMQSSNTSKLIFKIPHLIAYISQGITLEPGDVIATGTPEGVGFFRDPPVLLKAGDVYEVRIDQLGTLRNHVT